MKKIMFIITIIIVLMTSFIILNKNEENIIKKYQDEDVRAEYYIDNEIILNEISDFLSKNQGVIEIKKSKSCYGQTNCKKIGDYEVIGNYDGEINDIVEKMSQINLYSARKVFDKNNIDVLYNYFAFVQTHGHFIGYKNCVSELCDVEDDYYESVISKKTFYYKEKKINNEWSMIYTDIPSL